MDILPSSSLIADSTGCLDPYNVILISVTGFNCTVSCLIWARIVDEERFWNDAQRFVVHGSECATRDSWSGL